MSRVHESYKQQTEGRRQLPERNVVCSGKNDSYQKYPQKHL